MDGLKAMGTGARAAILAGGALIAGAAGYGIWSVNQPEVPVPVTAEVQPSPDAVSTTIAPSDAVATPAPAAETEAEPTTESASAAPEAAAPATAPVVPAFDLVRVEPDGQALVAGQAEPGAKIILRLDGAEISGSTADAQGEFVVLFGLDPSPLPRLLTLGSVLPGQSEIAALGEVALAPTTAATVVAAAETVADPVEAAVEPMAEAAPDPAPAAEAPAALLVTKDGVNVLQSGDQPDPADRKTDLALDTISYTPAGEVQLAGRATAGSVLRVYLDNTPLADVAVGENGLWASTMPTIAPGIYTLRVDALAADGAVTARFETPFKRETPDALAAATQVETPSATVATAEPAVPLETVAEPVAEAAPATEAAAVEPPAAAAVAATEPTPAPEQTEVAQIATVEEPKPTGPVSITVQPGFTLWGIASEQFGDGVLYVQVFEANKDKIRDPDLIYPGQVFVIPAGSE